MALADALERLEAAGIVKAAQIRERREARKAPTIGARGTIAGRRLVKTAEGWRYDD